MSPYIVHLTTVYLTYRNSTCPHLTHSVSLTGLMCCMDNANMVTVLCLVLNIVQIYIYLLIIIPIGIAGLALVYNVF